MTDVPNDGTPPDSGCDELVADRYRLVERVASGGMGTVWLAWDETLHRRVALKQLHPQPGLSPDELHVVRSRAEREARLTARLHHPHAVPVYDIVDDHGLPCLVMQYVPSKNLHTVLAERGTLEVAEVARMGSQVAGALTSAHQVGIVHRDVKPSNVLIEPDGTAKLTDFGISHALGDSNLTSTGMLTGTPAFLAPEVARGAVSSPSSDVFSLGATLYAALEGIPPFGDDTNPMAMLHAVASGQIRAPHRSGALTPVLLRMLAADPAARPGMSEVVQLLVSTSGSAGAPTERLTAPAVAMGVQSPTVMLPSTTGSPKPDRRLIAVVAAIAAAIVLAIVLVTQASGNGGPTTAATPPIGASGSPSTSSPTAPTSAAAVDAGPSATQLAQAITGYYGLLPDDTDAGWTRLTPAYQVGTTRGRKAYDDFWKKVDAVTVSKVVATPPNSVVATVRYAYADGTIATERTSYRLVRKDGKLLIDASTVQSSVTSKGDGQAAPDKGKPDKSKPGKGKDK